MKTKNPNCRLRAASPPGEKTSFAVLPIDSRTTLAFHQLRLHTEELALELTVRLRVLGKSLAAACPGRGAGDGKRTGDSLSYQNLRRQLDVFLGSLVDRDFSGHHYFPVIRHYLQDSLPYELHGCISAHPCRIEQVEAVISLLSESLGENDEFKDIATTSMAL